ncbi:MAG: glutaredoxin family protein [Thermodesulfobacteriota bacterium]
MSEDVMVYALSTCSHCKAAKRLLGECKIEFNFTDVDLLSDQDRKSILAEIKAFNPECSFPTIVIGKKVIVGYNEKEIKAALGMGKPGTGMIAKILAFFKKGA